MKPTLSIMTILDRTKHWSKAERQEFSSLAASYQSGCNDTSIAINRAFQEVLNKRNRAPELPGFSEDSVL
jgi:hypothetical protein